MVYATEFVLTVNNKKLMTLLHIKLPPDIHLSAAKASLLRVTFVLEFGVPQIMIEVDGIQVKAHLVEEAKDITTEHSNECKSPRTRSSFSPDDMSDTSSDLEEHVPTVDELANSFMREEPTEEIQELAQELKSQMSYMQESIASNDDIEEDNSTGVGAPFALPAYLRNILNTALDRLSIVVNKVDIEVEDQILGEISNSSRPSEASQTSLSFHIERIGIDSVTSEAPHIEINSATSPQSASSKSGKRRLRIDHVCARLVSDADNLLFMSQSSRPLSPETTRSEVSTTHQSYHMQAVNQAPMYHRPQTPPVCEEEQSEVKDILPVAPGEYTIPSASVSIRKLGNEGNTSVTAPPHREPFLAASVATVDDDRFADAPSDDGLEESSHQDDSNQSQHNLHVQELSASSILYDDERILEYALQNNMLNPRFNEELEADVHIEGVKSGTRYGSASNENFAYSTPASEASMSTLPTVSGLGVSFTQPGPVISPSQSMGNGSLQYSANQREVFSQSPTEDQASPISSTHSLPRSHRSRDDLAASTLSSQDASESMYMSAVSAALITSSSSHPQQQHMPGDWNSSPASNHDTASDRSGSIPEEMIQGSIFQPLPDVRIEDGCETPRPSSRQSATATTSHLTGAQPLTDNLSTTQKQAKVFLTIDEVTIWFPLGLDKGQASDFDYSADSASDASIPGFTPTRLESDSIFAEMPGSFSNYAHSTSTRRPVSMAESLRGPSQPKATPAQSAKQSTRAPFSPNVIVDVGSVVGHVDLSTGRIMFGMLDRVLKALADKPHQDTSNLPPENEADNTTSTVEITVKSIGVAWLESLLAEYMPNGFAVTRMLDLKPNDALLRANISRLRVTSQGNKGTVRTKLQIEKFALSSLGTDIISFHNNRPRSRRSVSNISEQLSHDIEIDYEQGTDKRVTIVTRPIKVTFDIQQLDDALSSFGGFSGVLELGNSISSNNALHSPVLSPSPPKPRGVHFGDTLGVPEIPVQASSLPKIQIQFGEVTFLLKGRSCAVHLQTTTVRIAIRQSNVRLKVSEVQLSGPYLDAMQRGAPLLVEVHGTTINFLFAPEEADLARLISLIIPSKDPYENNEDILIDTLLRQRRKGSVLRVEVSSVGVRVSDLEQLRSFEALGAELARLSKVTKYLPEDDRPGLLTLASLQQLDLGVAINDKLGDITVAAQKVSLAHVGFPSLFAVEVGTVSLRRKDEVLVHEMIKLRPQDQLPMIMIRMVGDELEPAVKVKLFNLCAEYRVSTIMAALGIGDDGTVEDIAIGIASSVATITRSRSPEPISRQSSQVGSPSSSTAKPLQIDLLIRSCAVGLNPRDLCSKGLFVLTEAHLEGKQAKNDYSIKLDLRKASIHAIDDIARLEEQEERVPRNATATTRHLQELSRLGFVSLSSISAANVFVKITGDGKSTPQLVNVEFKNELLVLESCADSTQTLIDVLNSLQPPTPPSMIERYRTVVPLQEMMESFTGDAIPAQGEVEDDGFMSNADLVEDEVPMNLEFVGSIYSQDLPTNEQMGDTMLDEDDLEALATSPAVRQRGDRGLLESFQEQYEVNKEEEGFDFSTDYFRESGSDRKGKARKWDSTQNQYHLTNEFKVPDAPLKVSIRDVNIIWNLFDGYDWPRTRSIISQAVDDVEARAEERRRKPRDEDEDEDFVEEDFLFNSVWIGVPIKEEKGALARRINHDIDDHASETSSYATSTATRSTGTTARPRSTTRSGRRRLKLERSKHKKIAFSLMGVAVDLVVFPPNSGETLNSIDVRVQDFEIFDHVPTSTWRKFVTCAIPPIQREMDRPMINLNLLTVKPVTDLAASELVIRVSTLMANIISMY